MLAGLCLSTVAAFAQDTQKTLQKPYQKWSEAEAKKIISNLPWANEYQSEGGLAAVAQQTQAREQSDTTLGGRNRGSGARNLTISPVTIRLHSALPVRQAMVRLQQIQIGYDKMSEDDRNKFDESKKVFLSCPACQNYYVVTLTKWRDSSPGAVDDGIFQTMKFEDFKGKVWLVNDKNEKRELVQFTPPKGAGESAWFFFKRTDDSGAPLLTSESKELKFVFDNKLLDNNRYSGLIPRAFEFKVPKLMFNNKVEF
ncbi:MAG TPA: hypothetical protein VF604_18860 [Pyrinomonadaceae bacterium]